MHSYSSVSISTQNFKSLASPITKIWLEQNLKKTDHVTVITPVLGVVCYRRLEFDTVYLHAKYDDYSFSCSRDIIGASKFKVGHVTLTRPLSGWFVILMLGLDIAYMQAKFDHSSSSRSEDMIGTHQNINGLRDLTTSLPGTVFRPWTSSCYDQPI